MTRNEKILSRIKRDMKIMEIGPSFSPVLMRADGWNVRSLDHCTADELRRKYAVHEEVDVSRIQEVDFVWRDGPLETAVPSDELGTFDACIGSHVIEHTPNLVSFFRSLERLLKPSGVISLVVPDKRFCFDFFQPLTMTGDVLEAHRTKRDRHTRAAEYNATAYMVRAGGQIAWGQHPTGLLTFYDGDVQAANSRFFRPNVAEEYRDLHGLYFTPSSFRLILLELAWVGYLDFYEAAGFGTENCEFFVTLARGRPKLTEEQFRSLRMDLLTNILLEVREQTDFLIDGPNYVGRPALVAA